jgi:biopolymer transport protein ExbB
MRGVSKVLLGVITVFASLLAAPGVGNAQTLERVALDQESRLEQALERLSELRLSIKEEQIPLARELAAKEAEAEELQSMVDRLRRLKDSRTVELETLRSRVTAQEAQINYIRHTLLPNYLADYDASLSIGERAQLAETILDYNLLLEDPSADPVTKLERGLSLLEDSARQLESVLGGQRFAGKALSPEGVMEQGTFLQIGPLHYFSSRDSGLAGLVEATRSLDARVLPLDPGMSEQLATVVASGSGVLPVDPSLGDALALEGTKDTLLEHLDKGGVWVYPILLFALAATLVAIWKSIQVFSIRPPEPMVIHEIIREIREGRIEKARELALAQPQPTREMLVAAVEHSEESIEMVEEVMYECMLGTQPKLERFLNVIAVTAAAAPLLGLLGTVTGIIKTFRLMSVFGAGDPKPLISGISEALITTELGLVLAIPALVLHAILSRKVAGVMSYMEKTAVTFVNGLSRSGK